MNIEDYFSADYPEARGKFLRLCEAHGYELTSCRNDRAQAPDGGDLFMDVATMGSPDAANVLMLTSATHGVEGYCGSGVQAALVGESRLAAAGNSLRVVLVHGVNPYGFAHDRRVNEDNIDLNRNFLDFGGEVPRDNGYSDIHAHLVPADWEGDVRRAADAALAEYAGDHGAAALQRAASGGQYTHSDGIFYGGTKPSWSTQTMLSLVRQLCAHAERANFIDFHTGLGPYGYGEMIAAGSPAQVSRTFDFYKGYKCTDPDAGTSSSAPVQGTMAHGIARALPAVETVFVALEYGTLPSSEVMAAVRADNWLYRYGSLTSPLGKQIKRQIRDAFYCDEAEWKQRVWTRALDVVNSTIDRLSVR